MTQRPIDTRWAINNNHTKRLHKNPSKILIQTSKKLRKLQKALDKNVLGGGSLMVQSFISED